MAQLSMTGLIVALDAFGPVTDNAGGIAEMADLPESVRGDHRPARRGRQHDEGGHEGLRDRLGRARGARPLRLVHDRASASRRHGSGSRALTFDLSDPWVIAGLFIGGLMPFLFASLAMEAVGRVGGEVVEEVRRQFREHPGIMEGTERPEYGRAIDIVTGSAIKSMLAPGADPDRLPDRRRDHQRRDARRPARRHDRHRPLPRDRDDRRRRRLGQREEDDRGRRSTAARAPRPTPPRSRATPSATPTRTPPARRSTR